jgi:flagellar hook assembly protein FlgD
MNKKTTLMIYDITGRLIKDLSFNLGSYIMDHASFLSWDGKDQAGRAIPPGVYYAVLSVGSGISSQKIIKLE